MTQDLSPIEQLVAALGQTDKPTIRAAVDALTPLAAQSDEIRSQLEVLLSAAAPARRWPLAYVLGQLPQPSGAAIRALLAGLDHGAPDIRWALALLLIRIAKEQGELVTLLNELCAQGTTNQKRMALYCLRDLQLQDQASRAALLGALQDGDATVRVAAVTSLSQRRDLGAGERGQLLKIFDQDSDLRVRNAAAITLARLGTPSPALIAALRAAALGDQAQLKKAAVVALGILQKLESSLTG